MMTRKDFKLIARTISKITFLDSHERELILSDFCYELSKTNPHFDRVKFLEACKSTQKYPNFQELVHAK